MLFPSGLLFRSRCIVWRHLIHLIQRLAGFDDRPDNAVQQLWFVGKWRLIALVLLYVGGTNEWLFQSGEHSATFRLSSD